MRGLLMIEPLYHQTVAGNKTQTRRSGGLDYVNENPDEWQAPEWREERISKNKTLSVVEFMRHGDRSTVFQFAPRYKVGEVLYLKEPTRQPAPGHPYWYRYTMYPDGKENIYNWNNKLFMPASAARAFVRITGIKCERLLDISDADCLTEGIEQTGIATDGTTPMYKDYKPLKFKGGQTTATSYPKESFLSLYKFANKVKDVPNLWVWVYEIEYLKDYQP